MKKCYLITILLLFSCLLNAQRLAESFESDIFPPEGWGIINQGDENSWMQVETKAKEGSHSVFMPIKTDDNDDYLISPCLEVSQNDSFSFWARQKGWYSEKINVLLSTSGCKKEDFNIVLDFGVDLTSSYQELKYPLADYVGKKIYIAIQTVSENTYSGVYLDNFSGPKIFIPQTPPMASTSVFPSNASIKHYPDITLLWSKVAYATGYKLSYGTNSDANNIIDKQLMDKAISFAMPKLDYSTTYYWKITPLNQYGDNIDAPVWSFTTMDDPTIKIFPFNEGFEGDNFPALGWKIIDNNSDGKSWMLNTSSYNANSGKKSLSLNYGDKDELFITAPIKVQDKLQFEFYVEGSSYSVQKMSLKISTTGSNYADFDKEILVFNEENGSYKLMSVDLSEYKGQRIYLAFYIGENNSVKIDDIRMYLAKNMENISSVCTQDNTRELAIGSTNAEVMKLTISTQGKIKPLHLKNITFNSKGSTSANDIISAKLYSANDKGEIDYENIFGELTSGLSKDFSILGDKELIEGDNIFYLAYDISATAKENNIIDASFLSYTLNETKYNVSIPELEGSRVLKKMFNLADGKSTYIVDGSVQFFDQGGQYENYSNSSEGSITFKAKTPASIIEIEFSEFEIFNTSSTGRNDVFKVYSGLEINEDKLIAEYSQMPPVLKSTDASGAITISFKSNSFNPKSGWKAVVREIVPADMIYKSSQEFFVSEETVLAGEQDIALLKIKITTDETLNPLSVNKLKLNMGQTSFSSDISKAKLFYTGSKDEFSSENVAGEIDNPSSEFEISINQKLKYGDNIFWLAYDINPLAKDDNIIDASCLSFSISKKEYTPARNSESKKLLVKNVFPMPVKGKCSKTVYAPFLFTSDDQGFSGKYTPTAYCVLTFKPAKAGDKIKISFKEFRLAISKTSYGVKAEFEVFNGDKDIKINSIYKAKYKDRLLGPEAALVSTADNGCLTVKFRANARSSSQAEKGWKAKVSSFSPTNMVFHSSTIVQNTDDIRVGAENQEILSCQVNTFGMLNPINNIKLSFNALGTSLLSDISNAKLFYTGSSDVFNTEKQIGDAVNNLKDEFSFSSSETLLEGENYFWLTYDIAASATKENIVDAQCVSLTIDDKKNTVEKPSPEGARRIKKIYTLEPGEDKLVLNNDPTFFYDNGGLHEKYNNNTNGVVVFSPLLSTDKVRLDISSLNLGSMCHFIVYNGGEQDDNNIIADLDNDENMSLDDKILIFKSTAEDGKLTVKFNSSKYDTAQEGWQAKVYSFTQQAISVLSVDQISNDESNILKAERNIEILRLNILTQGESPEAKINEFVFRTLGTTDLSDIVSASLYYSLNSENLNIASAQKYGETINKPKGEMMFSDDLSLYTEDSFYFFLVYDISKNASLGNYVNASCSSMKINNALVDVNAKPASRGRSIVSAMHGEFTIGENGDYASFNLAIKALEKGIDGPVVFSIKQGEYNEQLKFKPIKGSSADNTITFKSETENADDVLISYDKIGDTSYGSIKYGVVNTDGADFLNFENITFKTSNAGIKALVLIRNNSTDLNFKNNKFIAPCSQSYNGISCIESLGTKVNNENNDRINIENNIISGGYKGLSLSGVGYKDFQKEKSHRVVNNSFDNQGSKAMWISDIENLIVKGNIIVNKVSAKNNFSGIEIYRPHGKVEILSNNISFENKSRGAVGINLRENKVSPMNPIAVHNNTISIIAKQSGSMGMSIDDPQNMNIYHNSVFLLGKGESRAVLNFIKIPDYVSVSNNIFISSNAKIYAFTKSESISSCTFSYNNIYTESSVFVSEASKEIHSLDEWMAFSKAENSISEQVEFYSNTDLHLKKKANLTSSIFLLENDCEGEKRDKQKPTMGAYEYKAPSVEAPVFAKNKPALVDRSYCLANFSSQLNKNGYLYYAILGAEETPISINQLKIGVNSSSKNLPDGSFDKIAFRKDMKFNFYAKKLNSNTDYIAYIIVEDNLGNIADKIISIPFKTKYKPSETSSFESINIGDEDFVDGTAQFTDFILEEGEGANSSDKYIKLPAGKNASVEILNTDTGIVLNGFFVKTVSELIIFSGEENSANKISVKPEGEWTYVDLRELGEVQKLYFKSTDSDVFIDNFSSLPKELNISLDAEYFVDEGADLSIEALVQGGVKPYVYTWKPAGKQSNLSSNKVVFSPEVTSTYELSVTDKYANTSEKNFLVNVKSSVTKVASFEEIKLEKESFIMGDLSNEKSSFYSGSFKFNNFYSPDYFTWSGFSISNETSSDFESSKFLMHQFRNNAKGGLNQEGNYAVVYAFGFVPEIELNNGLEQDVLKGMYITNNAYAISSMTEGDSFTGEAFKQGDWYKLSVSGYDKDDVLTKTMDVYLADFRSGNKKDHFILKDWKWIDLSPLGEVKKVKFKVDGSRKNNRGLLIPAYFCMDNFNGSKIDFAPKVNYILDDVSVNEDDENSTIDISGLFSDPDNNDEDIKISIIDNDKSKLFSSSIKNNVLTIDYIANANGNEKISLKAESNGKTITTSFNVLINAIDDKPILENPIDDVEVNMNAEDTIIDLTNVFSDIDSDSFEYEIISNSNEELVDISVKQSKLILSYHKDVFADSDIIIKATADGKSVSCAFNVKVLYDGKLLLVDKALSTITCNEDAILKSVILDNVFKYIGDKSKNINIKASSDNDALLDLGINNNALHIKLSENAFGKANIKLTASCENETLSHSFNIIVNSLDDLPKVKSIQDIFLDMNAKDTIIDLSEIFSDIDNDEFTYSVLNNSNEKLLNISIVNDILTLSCMKNKGGQANVSIMGIAAGKKISTSFIYTIDYPGKQLILDKSIDNIIINEDTNIPSVDLSKAFKYLGEENADIDIKVLSHENESLLTYKLDNKIIDFSLLENKYGNDKFTIEASYKEEVLLITFNIEVNAIDDKPIVIEEIDDINLSMNAEDTIIDLSNVFSDIDNDEFTYSVLNNSNKELLSASIIDNILTLSYVKNMYGQGNITIQAQSGNKTVSSSFTVKINTRGKLLMLNEAISDISVNEDTNIPSVDLSKAFKYLGEENADIYIKVLSHENESLLTYKLNNKIIDFSLLENKYGKDKFTVEASYKEETLLMVFNIEVNAVDDKPIVIGEINDINLSMNAEDTIIDLVNVFSDIDNDEFTYSILKNSNKELLSLSIIDNILTLSYVKSIYGQANVTIQAQSGNKTVSSSFTVKINARGKLLMLNEAISDISVNEDTNIPSVDLSKAFKYLGEENADINIKVLSHENESLLTYKLNNKIIDFSLLENKYGKDKFTVEASYKEETLLMVFNIEVNAVDDKPIVIGEINDINLSMNAEDTIIDLTNVFSDIDNEKFIYSVLNNSNKELLSASIIDNILTLSYVKNMYGQGNITIQAQSGNKIVSSSFTVKINAKGELLMLNEAISDISVNEDTNIPSVDLSKAFKYLGEENADINIKVLSHENESLLTYKLDNKIIDFSLLENKYGKDKFTIEASYKEEVLILTFLVDVKPIDDKPFIVNKINDINLKLNAKDTSINLLNVFGDVDNDEFSYTVFSNSNEDLVKTNIIDNKLTLSYVKDNYGDANICIQAESAGEIISSSFIVNIDYTGKLLMVNKSISDISADEDTDISTIDLSETFKYLGDKNAIIDIKVSAHENESLLSYKLKANMLSFYLLPNKYGKDKFTIEALCKGETLQLIFNIDIKSVDDNPIVIEQIEDISIAMNSENTIIDLSEYFMDVDTEDLTYIVNSNSNDKLVKCDIENNMLSLVYTKNVFGESDISISIVSGQQTASIKFNVSIDNVLSVHDITLSKVKIYPNPCKDFLYLDMGNYKGEIQVRVYNTSGALVFYDIRNYQSIECFDAMDLKKGYYIFKISFKENSVSRKILKL